MTNKRTPFRQSPNKPEGAGERGDQPRRGRGLQRCGGGQVHVGGGLGGGHLVATENAARKVRRQAHLGQLHLDLETVGP